MYHAPVSPRSHVSGGSSMTWTHTPYATVLTTPAASYGEQSISSNFISALPSTTSLPAPGGAANGHVLSASVASYSSGMPPPLSPACAKAELSRINTLLIDVMRGMAAWTASMYASGAMADCNTSGDVQDKLLFNQAFYRHCCLVSNSQAEFMQTTAHLDISGVPPGVPSTSCSHVPAATTTATDAMEKHGSPAPFAQGGTAVNDGLHFDASYPVHSTCDPTCNQHSTKGQYSEDAVHGARREGTQEPHHRDIANDKTEATGARPHKTTATRTAENSSMTLQGETPDMLASKNRRSDNNTDRSFGSSRSNAHPQQQQHLSALAASCSTVSHRPLLPSGETTANVSATDVEVRANLDKSDHATPLAQDASATTTTFNHAAIRPSNAVHHKTDSRCAAGAGGAATQTRGQGRQTQERVLMWPPRRRCDVVLVEFKRQRIVPCLTDCAVEPGDYVMIPGDRGFDCGVAGQVGVWDPKEGDFVPDTVRSLDGECIDVTGLRGPLRQVLRLATQDEVAALLGEQVSKERLALRTCQSLIAKLNLPMEVFDCEYQFDGTKISFFFDSSSRIDFRDLNKELYRIFNARIWLENVADVRCHAPPPKKNEKR